MEEKKSREIKSRLENAEALARVGVITKQDLENIKKEAEKEVQELNKMLGKDSVDLHDLVEGKGKLDVANGKNDQNASHKAEETEDKKVEKIIKDFNDSKKQEKDDDKNNK